jgi:hypothetical protein
MLTPLFFVVLLCTPSILTLLADCSLGILLGTLHSLGGNPTENTVSQQFVREFASPLSRNELPIVPRYDSAGTCLATRCLAMDITRTT